MWPSYFAFKTIGWFLIIFNTIQSSWYSITCPHDWSSLCASFVTAPPPKSYPAAHCSSPDMLCSRPLWFLTLLLPLPGALLSRASCLPNTVLSPSLLRHHFFQWFQKAFGDIHARTGPSPSLPSAPPKHLPDCTTSLPQWRVTWEQNLDEPPSQCLAQGRHIIKPTLLLLGQTPSNII